MKKTTRILSLLTFVLLAALIFPTNVQAATPEDGRTIFGESFTLNNGEILDGDLNVFGGVVQVMDGARVTGNLLVVGGVVTVDGTIEGNLTAVGGTVSLTNNAIIQGNLVSPGSYVNTSEGADIQGDIIQGWALPDTNIQIPDAPPTQIVQAPSYGIVSVFTRIAREIGQLLAMVALGALLLLILPKPVEVMTQSLRAQPWIMLGFGALTAVVLVIGGVILALTICLIPVVVLAVMAFILATLAGWLTLGYEVGKQMASSIFKTSWHPVLTAVIGNLTLYILARGLWMIPCLGWTIVVLVALIGLGMAVVTLFGTNPYPRTAASAKPEQEVLTFDEVNDDDQENDEA
jgi:cytoskeletal protein CcmA (bactofilin family)